MNESESSLITETKCFHKFHTKCLLELIKTKIICPVCRTKLNKNDF